MLASAVGVDGPGEGDVGRLVARQDAAGLLGRDLGGARSRLILLALPTIGYRLARLRRKAMRPTGGRATALEGDGTQTGIREWRPIAHALYFHTVYGFCQPL